ncbi:hypothetical protein HDZ31DRAFT_30289 [Schizophyllum fasciatum]
MALQLRKLAFKVVNSSTILLPAWKEILQDLNMRVKLLPRDVRTRWNSTYDMLVSALEHRDAIDKMYKRDDVVKEIEPLELSRHEWKCAEQLRDALDQATEYFSRANRPNLPFVIVAMDELDRQLSTMSINTALEPAIRAAAGLAKRTLNRYYSLTDQADSYRVSMGAWPCLCALSCAKFFIVLHPRHKLEYFKRAGWASDWVAEAERITRHAYDSHYVDRDVVRNEEEVIPAPQQAKVRHLTHSHSFH